jgi:uncharacterized protein (TIGR02147 family)
MKKTVFDFTDYRLFLKHALETTVPSRGARSRLAHHLGCQSAFVSQVLAGKVDFSLEHAVRIGAFLGLSEAENHFLILLIHLGRAGSRVLRDYYQTQVTEILEGRNRIEERIEVRNELSFEDQAVYYDGWYYAAIHVALSLSRVRTAQALSARLGIPLPEVQRVLDFLVKSNLAKRSGAEYSIGERRIHLKKDSAFVRKHHINWRMKSIVALDFPTAHDLHYSGVFTLTEADFGKVREMLLETLQRSEPVLRASKEETIGAFCLDWFRL